MTTRQHSIAVATNQDSGDYEEQKNAKHTFKLLVPESPRQDGMVREVAKDALQPAELMRLRIAP
jgi:hypothetical protein